LIDSVSIFQSAARQNSEPNAENLGKRRVNVGRVGTLSDQIVVDFLRSQINVNKLVFLSLKQGLIISQFSRKRDAAYYFYLPALVYQYIAGMDVSNLFLEQLKFVASSHDIVQ
jgi:hypothetical protein